MEGAKVKELKQFLKDRGVPYAGYKKKDLLTMCKLAADADVEVDPDGLQENIDGIIANKLQLDTGDCLPLPSACEGSADISYVPAITVIDIYNYLLNFSQYDHTMLCNYYKMEGCTMFQDGFVMDVQGVRFADHADYIAVKAKVRWLFYCLS